MLQIYMRILTLQQIHHCAMSFLGNTGADDYKNDIKPDQSVPLFTDSISSIVWAPQHVGNFFATTSWDGDLRVLSVEQGQYGIAIFQKMSNKFASPALKCTWNDQGNQIYVGLMDGSVKLYDLGNGQVSDIGKHGAPISSLHYIPGMNAIISTAYEPMIQIWQQGNPSPVLSINAENKVFASEFQSPILVAGTANQRILIIDINNQNSRSIIQSVDLGKFSQIQSVTINHKCSNFGIASFDGRANISSLSKNVNGVFASKTVITFKSNKQEESGNTILYPINSISFNPINDRWFMTAGSDGAIHFWDFEAKNKIKTLNYGGIPISAAKVSPRGDMIAYGLGNDWHLGQQGVNKWQVKIGVHPVAQNETKFAK